MTPTRHLHAASLNPSSVNENMSLQSHLAEPAYAAVSVRYEIETGLRALQSQLNFPNYFQVSVFHNMVWKDWCLIYLFLLCFYCYVYFYPLSLMKVHRMSELRDDQQRRPIDSCWSKKQA